MLKEVPEAFLSISQEVEMLQTQPCYQTGAAKRTFCTFFIHCYWSNVDIVCLHVKSLFISSPDFSLKVLKLCLPVKVK